MRDAERIELEALADLFALAPPPARSVRSGNAIALVAPGGPVEVNRIVGLRSLDELGALEDAYGGGPVTVSLDPATGLEEALLARGYAHGYPWQKFERTPEPVEARTELRIARAADPGRFGSTAAAGFGLPAALGTWLGQLVGREGWHCLVAFDGEEPVATGVLFARDGVGWLGIGATVPAHRGRGGQSALLAARVTLGAELGLRLLVTETGVPRAEGPGPSYRNIVRAGFDLAYVRQNLVKGAG
jgi:hypothetical protein